MVALWPTILHTLSAQDNLQNYKKFELELTWELLTQFIVMLKIEDTMFENFFGTILMYL